MHAVAVLQDMYSRIGPTVHGGVDEAPEEMLVARLDPEANTIAWLAWHIGRGQDLQVASASGREQVWTAGGWADRFALPFGPDDVGFGHSADDVAQVRAPAHLLLGYVDAVQAESADVLGRLDDSDLDTVIDKAWDPPVTLGVRLISVAGDSLQHAAQIAYVRGVLERSDRA